jgi:hypothetical protein
MSPPALVSVIFYARYVLDAETEVANLVPSVAEAELSFSVECGAIVEHFGNVSGAVGFEVRLGDFEGFIAGHFLSPFLM